MLKTSMEPRGIMEKSVGGRNRVLEDQLWKKFSRGALGNRRGALEVRGTLGHFAQCKIAQTWCIR